MRLHREPRVNHGELTTVSVELADGYQHIRCVIVEVKRVPRNRRRRILNRFDGTKFAVMRPADYICVYGVQPWEGSTRRASRWEMVH
jgi:hypothetical protein